MMSCEAVRQRLAEDGIEAAERQAEVRRHLEGCADCRRVRDALARVDGALAELPGQDAPDPLVAGTLEAVRRAAKEGTPSHRPGPGMRYLAGGLAASVVIAAGLGLSLGLLDPLYQSQTGGREFAQLPQAPAEQQLAQGPVAQNKPSSSLRSNELPASEAETAASRLSGAAGQAQSEGAGDRSEYFETARRAEKKAAVAGEYRAKREGQEVLATRELLDAPAGAEAAASDSDAEWAIIAQLAEAPPADKPVDELVDKLVDERAGARQRRDAAGAVSAEVDALDPQTRPAEPPASLEPLAKTKDDEADGDGLFADLGNVQSFAGSLDEAASAKQSGAKEEAPVGGLVSPQPTNEPAEELAEEELALSHATSADELNRPAPSPAVSDDNAERAQSRDQSRAEAFLHDYQTLAGLAFQEPSGYWANSYIPGDPAMRLLEARLRTWNRAALGADLRLEQDVRPVSQPFDAPQDAALAVYLDADRAAIDGPTRLRVQVGLKGAERQGGHRPAMNLGLVVDLRGASEAELGRRVRALVAALERAQQPGDRFSLSVAGPGGGLLVAPEEFRHGPLQVALESLFGAEPDATLPAVGLPEAVALAGESVRAGDNPEAVLGSSLVLLATGGSLAEDLEALEGMAHRNAVAGVPLSVVSLGAREDLSHIDRLVAAGQGSRRILDTAQAADGLVDRELHAASRAVARAVRLRIRLAPGVKLIDVLGSRRLGEPQAERVREAEQSIDRRLARNLGIAADRGEDEDGIQVVIPNFYAGDSHVILLDVVAETPGPVADVTVRYKDVAYLRNGVAEASLALGQGREVAGPLQRNVLKNLVAWDYARELRAVGRALAAGDGPGAVARLAGLRDLIRGLRREVTGWSADADLAADEALLERYLAVLGSPRAADGAQRSFLADSLGYAAYRKLQSAAR